MLICVVLVIFAAAAVNAGLHSKFHRHHQHFTIDMDGFHHHGHHNHEFGFQHGRLPSPPVYGPPPFSPHLHQGHHHNHHHHHHTPGDGCGMIESSNPNTMPFIPNIMPFAQNPMLSNSNNMPLIPNMVNPFNLGTNFPFNPQNPFLPNPHQIGGNIGPNNFGFDTTYNPLNLPKDPLPTGHSTYDTNTKTPLDANTVFEGQGSSTPSIFDVLTNGGNPTNPTSHSKGMFIFLLTIFEILLHKLHLIHTNVNNDCNQKTGSHETKNPSDANENSDNNNNYNGTGAIATNNDVDMNNQTNVPGVDEPTTTITPSDGQGKFNGLDYDIDVRFSDAKKDNSPNQNASDTIKP